MSEGAFSRPLVAGASVQKMMTEVLPHRPSQLLDTLGELDFQMAVTVPDGWLGQLLVQIENHVDMQLIRATHEEEALAIACGARIGGARTVLLVQNVGIITMGAGMVLSLIHISEPTRP